MQGNVRSCSGEKVFEAFDPVGIESDFVYTTKRIFEVNICSHGKLDCIKCSDVFQKIHEVETGKEFRRRYQSHINHVS